MKQLFVLLSALGTATFAAADVPDVVITTMTSSNGHATIAGRLVAKPAAPVGVSVRNGNIIYSTITDGEGRWGLVIRHQTVNVTANSWNLTNPSDRGKDVEATDARLPWTRSVSARESSSSESSAKYQTETSLRYQVDRERTNCRYDKGTFSASGGFVYCNKQGSNYICSGTTSCSCR